MQQPLALLTRNATIFWEHEVFVDRCHSNTAIYIFSVIFSKKVQSVKIMEKISVLILVLLTNICFIIRMLLLTIPNVSLNLV